MGLDRLARIALLGAALAGTCGAVIVPETAAATTFANLTEEQLTDASTWIVRGTVQELWMEQDDAGRVWTRARVEVARVFKGPRQTDELIVDTMGGRVDESWTSVPGAARFSEGEDVLLFLAEIHHGEHLTPVEMYRGKFTIRRAPGETRPYAMRWQARERTWYDHRFLPHPDPSLRVDLQDLVDRVEARLDTGWDGQPVPGLTAQELREINTPERRFRR